MKKIIASMIFVMTLAFVAGTAAYANNEIAVTIDGVAVEFDVPPQIVDGRTLVPVRGVFEALGFEVEWKQDIQTAILERDNLDIFITIGNQAFIRDNGDFLSAFVLDVPAQIIDGRTMLPIRAVLESVGYKVDWIDETRTVAITGATYSRLSSTFSPRDAELIHWITAASSVILAETRGQYRLIGFPTIPDEDLALLVQLNAQILFRTGPWNINSADDIERNINNLMAGNSNQRFLAEAELIRTVFLVAEELGLEVAIDPNVQLHQIELIMYLDEKWGEQGVIGWDLIRIGHLVSWGHEAGYFTLEEALELFEPVVPLLQANFSSWQEAIDSWLDGFAWWGHHDISDPDSQFAQRHEIFANLQADFPLLFDNSLFMSYPVGSQRAADDLHYNPDYLYMLSDEPIPTSTSAIIGHWFNTTDGRGFLGYYFREDGTYVQYSGNHEDGFASFGGTFTLSDDGSLLTLTRTRLVNREGVTRLFVGEAEQFIISEELHVRSLLGLLILQRVDEERYIMYTRNESSLIDFIGHQ
ncbi:MAG: stalk domain-containing protein [Defluviitaleaceae bacterium]|nr:stalk domain-containing protein [Defluviitaleaceae bacterium]